MVMRLAAVTSAGRSSAWRRFRYIYIYHTARTVYSPHCIYQGSTDSIVQYTQTVVARPANGTIGNASGAAGAAAAATAAAAAAAAAAGGRSKGKVKCFKLQQDIIR
jgi:hypothetical protein